MAPGGAERKVWVCVGAVPTYLFWPANLLCVRGHSRCRDSVTEFARFSHGRKVRTSFLVYGLILTMRNTVWITLQKPLLFFPHRNQPTVRDKPKGPSQSQLFLLSWRLQLFFFFFTTHKPFCETKHHTARIFRQGRPSDQVARHSSTGVVALFFLFPFF